MKNRRKAKKESEKSQSNVSTHAKESPNDHNYRKWLVLGGLVLLLAAGVYYSLNTVDYSGPKFATSERGEEKRREKERTIANKDKDAKKETPDNVKDASSCPELTRGARSLLSAQSPKPQEIELALDMLATCALKDETQPGPRWNLAAALLQVNRSNEALPFINEALTLDPTNTEYLYEGGRVMSRLGLYDQAIRCWEKYLEIKLSIPNWGQLLERLSLQREDEWEFLHEIGQHVVSFLELLLNAYLRQYSFIKSSFLYRILIGLRGMERSQDLIGRYAFYAFSIGDLANGIGYLQYHTEQSYIAVGYGGMEQAREIIKAHSLRLFTGGIDSTIVAMIRNLLMAGKPAWDELVYHCNLNMSDIDISKSISLSLMKTVFSSCVISQEIVPKLLEREAVVHAENIFGWTPLLQIISLDNPTILHQVLKGHPDIQSRTAMGLTSLHIAAITGSSSVMLPLIQGNLKHHTKDALNRTALDLACLNGWYYKEFANALKVSVPHTGCPVKPNYLPPLEDNISKSGGWYTSGIALPMELTNDRCDIEVIGYNTTPEELITQYLSISRPVLIRNATNSKVMKKLHQLWQRNKLVKEYSDIVLNEVSVPFAESFGYDQPSQTTLRAFLDKMTKLHKKQQQVRDIMTLTPPTYIFQSLPRNSPLLAHFVIPRVLDESKTEISTEKIQFYVGGALSGAPPHFHRTAWNALIYGRKRWFIFPPRDSFYSKVHVWDWWRYQYRNEAVKTAWECVQYPGDVIVLPDMWGHAVINLRESVGVASEFVYGASEFSL